MAGAGAGVSREVEEVRELLSNIKLAMAGSDLRRGACPTRLLIRGLDTISTVCYNLDETGRQAYGKENGMSRVTAAAKLLPEDLIRAVTLLSPNELSEFVLRFDEWRLTDAPTVNGRAAQIAEANRLPIADRQRLAELLAKNREEGLIAEEESELDAYMSELDLRLNTVADELLNLSRK